MECPDDVFGSFWVDRDGADFAAVVDSTLVEVAERCAPFTSVVPGLAVSVAESFFLSLSSLFETPKKPLIPFPFS